jgi:hypothetical protein
MADMPMLNETDEKVPIPTFRTSKCGKVFICWVGREVETERNGERGVSTLHINPCSSNSARSSRRSSSFMFKTDVQRQLDFPTDDD